MANVLAWIVKNWREAAFCGLGLVCVFLWLTKTEIMLENKHIKEQLTIAQSVAEQNAKVLEAYKAQIAKQSEAEKLYKEAVGKNKKALAEARKILATYQQKDDGPVARVLADSLDRLRQQNTGAE